MPAFKRLFKRSNHQGKGRTFNPAQPAVMTHLDNAEDALGDFPRERREGLHWITLMASGHATTDDLAAMEHWRLQDASHADALRWALKLRRLIAAQNFPAARRPAVFALNGPMTRRLVLGGAGAAAASYVAITSPLGLWPSWSEWNSDYRTGVGEQRQVAVAPGVQVILGARTSVALFPQPDMAAVKLIDGEAVIDADGENHKRFGIFTDNTHILLAQNAKVNIRSFGGQDCVTCLRGSVIVASVSGTFTLPSGQQLLLTSGHAGKPFPADVASVTAWQHGKLVFHNMPFGAMIDEINRYRQGRIIVLNPELAHRRFDGLFKIAELEKVAENLQQLSNASVTKLPGGILLVG